ncbi:NUDIX domain-containing protein [Streptomyces albidochromogenes]|uniref:NUDIX domain-containing protein n=1 Tax=Streptomyces albidochromogenes TaxID=329524 RepID=UPI00110FECF8
MDSPSISSTALRGRAIRYSPRVSAPTKKPVRHSHCSSCGAPYRPAAHWPRTCPSCGDTAYRNPLPVAVALLPVKDAQGGRDAAGGGGLVVITRAIEPQLGGTALPGGFIDHGERWQEAVVRELREETGIEAAANDVRLADALSSPAGHLLLFGLLPARAAADLPPSAPTDETTGWHVLRAPADLAFPLHTEAVRQWFSGSYGPTA